MHAHTYAIPVCVELLRAKRTAGPGQRAKRAAEAELRAKRAAEAISHENGPPELLSAEATPYAAASRREGASRRCFAPAYVWSCASPATRLGKEGDLRRGYVFKAKLTKTVNLGGFR